ncbi:MAG: TonB-dependent receptor [Pseudomonadota bacterium]
MTSRSLPLTKSVLATAVGLATILGDAKIALAQLEEVTVTARRVVENLQDVPVTVQALSSETIRDYNIFDFNDMNNQVSSLNIYTLGPTQPSVNLRGIQGDAVNAANDEPVSVNLDGVSHSSAQLFRFGLFDVQSVEVLKGPQALFFGKNSPGGIIAVRTKNPTEEFSGDFLGGYEANGERYFGHAILSGPLTDNWGARVGFRYEESDGLYNNIWGDGDPTATQPVDATGPQYEDFMFNGTLRGEWENFDITFKAYNANREGGQYNAVGIKVCNDATPILNPFSDCKISDDFSAADAFTVPPGNSVFAADEPTFEYELTQLTMDINYQFNENWSVNSITGWIDLTNFLFGNVGARPVENIDGGLFQGTDIAVESFSQEFRVTGDYDNWRINTGVFFDDRETVQGGQAWIAPFFKLIPDSEGTVKGESWSIYGQFEYDLNDLWTISLGARYTDEDRSVSGRNLESFAPLNLGGVVVPEGPWVLSQPDINYTNLSPEFVLSYRPTDNMMFFASVKEGFKSGGYNLALLDAAPTTLTQAPLDNTFEEETVLGFEVGAKMELLDNTLRINTTLFSYNFEDLQQAAIFQSPEGGIILRTINAGEANTQGIEVDFAWNTPVEGLTFTGNATYNDSEFDDYVSQCNEFQIFVDPAGCNVDVDGSLATDAGGLLAGTGFDAQDRAGHQLRRAPEFSGSLTATYETAVSESWRLRFNLQATYTDDSRLDGENNPWAVQEDYWIYNGFVGLYSTSSGWSFDLMVRNITDEAVAIDAFDLSRSNLPGIPQATAYDRNKPREIIGQISYRF